ncbi:TDT family transporter [Streptomyces sp. HNM0574]|uniref:TDT family transporter n=1 Tax=Streptomyces sp. HNM0574 TaxID=2714954 RepID=UPI00146D60D6|nr:TDT family transporter [Streptomyces sp. HNM0574]NLU66241.1 TDT family transporter [Streptomyces sp. HNM0574]
MTTLAHSPVRPLPPPGPGTARLRHLAPNWYAAVMGTAIIAGAGAALPWHPGWLRPALTVVWTVSALMLAALLTARSWHWLRHTEQARAHLRDPAVAPFYGCLPMALLAVGGGALATGIPGGATVDLVLWSAGTALGVVTAVGVPYLMVVRHEITPGKASPVWLLPVVAPMVSAALGPPLAEQLPAGQGRSAMLLGCFALFGMSLFATLLILPAVFSGLVHHGAPAVPATPTLVLVLGPLGQSTTAVGNLADAAPGGFTAASVLYGVPVMGFALMWLLLSAAMVLRALRHGMRFTMTWWAFTFPVGTCVTGAAALARHTGLHALNWLAAALYALLVTAWAVALFRTGRGLLSGELLAAPRPAPAAPR